MRRHVEQPHDRRDDPLPAQRRAGAGRARRGAGCGAAPGERDQPVVLRLVAHLAPPRVVAVLLAAARVAPGRLDVAVRRRADPDVGPRRRDRERVDSRSLGPVVIVAPSGPMYWKPRPRLRRVIPGSSSLTWRRPAAARRPFRLGAGAAIRLRHGGPIPDRASAATAFRAAPRRGTRWPRCDHLPLPSSRSTRAAASPPTPQPPSQPDRPLTPPSIPDEPARPPTPSPSPDPGEPGPTTPQIRTTSIFAERRS